MKAFIALAVACFIASAMAATVNLTEEQKAKTKQHFSECLKQENVSEQDADRLRKKDFSNPSPSMKCFGACFFEKVGVLKDNKVQEDVALEKLGGIVDDDKAKEVLAKCKASTGAERCETGYKMFECLDIYKPQLAN